MLSAPRSLARSLMLLPRFLGPRNVSGPCKRVVGRRRLLATGGLALCLEIGYGTLGACGVHLRLFQPHPCMFLILHFDVVSGPFGDNAYAN